MCLAQVGRGLEDGATLAVYSRTLASLAAALGDRLEETGSLGSLGSLHLEYQEQSLLITRIASTSNFH